MAHDWDWKAGPRGGTLTDLDTVSRFVRVLDEGSPGSHGSNVPAQYLHGAREVAHLFSQENLIPLEIGVQSKTQLTDVKKLLYGSKLMTTLQKTDPDWGTVQIDGKMFQPVASTQDRFTFLFPFLAADPFWRSTTLNGPSSPTPSIAVGGNAPVDDAEIVFATGTDPILTHTDSGATIQIEGAVPAGGVRVYARTGWAERVTGGTDYGEFLVLGEPYVLELDPDQTNAFTLSTGTATISWRNKFR